jgi:hypothetical protein
MDNNKSKTDFVNNIQKWVATDTQLKSANEKIRQIRDSKNQLTVQICNFVDTHNIRSTKLDISDGNLKVYDRKEYAPLTFGYIEESLHKIIPNKEHVEYIVKYIKDNREVTTTSDIRRNTTK